EILGFKPDERNYIIAAKILKDLGISHINLLTNNPDKIDQLENNGITIEKRIPLEIPANKVNHDYLETKRDKFHHLLEAL
ncbi:bifunctional 3,4-dihydroxy-2-butanone-4-phosphate synthase/GTP cyclohydrolase II, partial [Lactobacillus crispatus]